MEMLISIRNAGVGVGLGVVLAALMVAPALAEGMSGDSAGAPRGAKIDTTNRNVENAASGRSAMGSMELNATEGDRIDTSYTVKGSGGETSPVHVEKPMDKRKSDALEPLKQHGVRVPGGR